MIRVRLDRDETELLDSNAKRGGGRMVKLMNVVAWTTPVAVLVTLGLALAAECEVNPRQVVATSAGDGKGNQQ
jgi:hypothetical protein